MKLLFVLTLILQSHLLVLSIHKNPLPMKEGHDWSLLVGKQASEVESTIRQMRPDLNVHVLKEGSIVTMDFRTDRVRVYTNEHGVVTQRPIIG